MKSTNTMITKKPLQRSFGGKVGNKVSEFKDKHEMALEKKHLKAYLQGRKFFAFGTHPVTGEKIYAPVKEVWTKLT